MIIDISALAEVLNTMVGSISIRRLHNMYNVFNIAYYPQDHCVAVGNINKRIAVRHAN